MSILVLAVIIGLLILGVIVAAHGFAYVIQTLISSDPSPPRV